MDIFDYNVPILLEFFTKEFQGGAAYGTLNSLRSALSLLISSELGSDSRVKRFFKGLQNLKPNKPRYDHTWDPEVVLNYLAGLNNEKISLEVLSKKLAMLLALTTGHRVQTLSLIDTRNIVWNNKGVEIKIPDRIKTTRRNANQPTLFLPHFAEKPEICVVRTLEAYLHRTTDLRPPTCHKLLLAVKKPHHEANPQTLSRWIKGILGESGIDTTIFSAHSTRHASTSAASRKGVSLDVIRKTAGWSSNSDTFARFYDRPLRTQGLFAKAILK